MHLTSNYQYIGRAGPLLSPGGYGYYALLYAKTEGSTATGVHTLSLKLRLACNVDSSFYNWYSAGYIAADGVDGVRWHMAYKPDKAWSSQALTEDGHTYPRWVDTAEGSLKLPVGYGTERQTTLTWGYEMLDYTAGGWFPEHGVPISGSALVTLPEIPGATVPEVPNGTLGSSLTIGLTPVRAHYTHTLRYSFGSLSGTIATKASGDISWTPPTALASEIPNAASGTVRITCVTFDGDTQIGSPQTVTATLSVPASLGPEVTASWADRKAIPGGPARYLSALTVTPEVTCRQGAVTRAVSVTLNGKSYAGGLLQEAGDLELAVTATDSRGLSATYRERVTVVAYELPSVTVDASRWSAADESGVADDMGEFARVTVRGETFPMPDVTAQVTLEAGSFRENRVVSGTFEEIFYIEAPSASSMTLKAMLSDGYETAASSMTLSVGYATMDFLKGGKGIAFGTTATGEGFTCAMPARFTGGVSISGLADLIYPVGSIYMSVGNVSPAAFFGGTWERIQDRFLLAAGSVYAAGATGGAATHTLTLDEMPSHNHGLTTRYKSAAGDANSVMLSDASTGGLYTFATGSGPIGWTGGNAAHNNMPPYLAVYIWKRTA